MYLSSSPYKNLGFSDSSIRNDTETVLNMEEKANLLNMDSNGADQSVFILP